MTWLLAVFMPGHTRGAITMTRAADGHATLIAARHSCCEPASHEQSQPSKQDRSNCAVCFWAAGLLSDITVSFEHEFRERVYEAARVYDAQVRAVACQLTHHGRDPPADALV